jgi:copper oxidase (laccase) domain-containing protein
VGNPAAKCVHRSQTHRSKITDVKGLKGLDVWITYTNDFSFASCIAECLKAVIDDSILVGEAPL